jgi:hypothetical protein
MLINYNETFKVTFYNFRYISAVGLPLGYASTRLALERLTIFMNMSIIGYYKNIVVDFNILFFIQK